MSVLSGQSIGENVIIVPFHLRQKHVNGMSWGLSASGYDLRIKDDLLVPAGQFRLATTMEYIDLPTDIQGMLLDKSTLARQGISMFNTKFEPGWRGFPTVEIANHSFKSYQFYAGDPLCQMEFQWLDQPTEFPYEGKYQDQEQEPTEARYEPSGENEA